MHTTLKALSDMQRAQHPAHLREEGMEPPVVGAEGSAIDAELALKTFKLSETQVSESMHGATPQAIPDFSIDHYTNALLCLH
jgi:hypothetical protein